MFIRTQQHGKGGAPAKAVFSTLFLSLFAIFLIACGKGEKFTLAQNPNSTITGNNTVNLTDITPPVATATPGPGIYSAAQNITLSADEPASIYYTTDGTVPDKNSKKFTGPFMIYTNKTLKFIAYDLAGNKSPVYSAVYEIYDIGASLRITQILGDKIRSTKEAGHDGSDPYKSVQYDQAVVEFTSSYDADYYMVLTDNSVGSSTVACGGGTTNVTAYDTSMATPLGTICSGTKKQVGVKGSNTTFTADGVYKVWVCADVYSDRIAECGGATPKASVMKFTNQAVSSSFITYDNTGPNLTFSQTPDAVPPLLGPGISTFDAAQFVTISADDGAESTIHYTLGDGVCGSDSGVDPNRNSEVFTTPIYIVSTTCIRAYAYDKAGNESGTSGTPIVAWTYDIQTSGPTVSVDNPGNLKRPEATYDYLSGQVVTITASGSLGGPYDIYYTLDGTDPQSSPTRQSCLSATTCPVTLTKYSRLRVTAKDEGKSIYSSSPLDETYVIGDRAPWRTGTLSEKFYLYGDMNIAHYDINTSMEVLLDKSQMKNLPPEFSKGYNMYADDPNPNLNGGATPADRQTSGILLMNMDINSLMDNSLQIVFHGDPAFGTWSSDPCGKTVIGGSVYDDGGGYYKWNTGPEAKMQMLMRMCPNNAIVDGTSVESMIDLVASMGWLGLPSPPEILSQTMSISRNEAFISADNIKAAIVSNIINPHQYSSLNIVGATGCPTGADTCAGKLPVYLSDSLEDLATMSRYTNKLRLGAGSYDTGGAVMTTFSPASTPAVMTDQFKMIVPATIVAQARQGYEFLSHTRGNKDAFDTSNITLDVPSMDMVGLVNDPKVNMDFLMEESPYFYKGRYSSCDSGNTNSFGFGMPSNNCITTTYAGRSTCVHRITGGCSFTSQTLATEKQYLLEPIIQKSGNVQYTGGSGEATATILDILAGCSGWNPIGVGVRIQMKRRRSDGWVYDDSVAGVGACISFDTQNPDYYTMDLLTESAQYLLHGYPSYSPGEGSVGPVDGADVQFPLRNVSTGLSEAVIKSAVIAQMDTPSGRQALLDASGAVFNTPATPVDVYMEKISSVYHLCFANSSTAAVKGFYQSWDGVNAAGLSSPVNDTGGSTPADAYSCLQVNLHPNQTFFINAGASAVYRVDMLPPLVSSGARMQWYRLK